VIYQLLEQEITFTEGIHAHAQYVLFNLSSSFDHSTAYESSSTIQTFIIDRI